MLPVGERLLDEDREIRMIELISPQQTNHYGTRSSSIQPSNRSSTR
jgi:hypothetical protein